MEFQARKAAAAVVVTLVGRLDAVTAPDYERRMHELIGGGDVRVVIDFERLDYISSAGLRGLLVTAKQLKAKGGQLRFANIQGGVRAVFDMSGFGSMFQLDESVASALAALS